MRLKLKAWFVFDGGTKFGEGRAELLRLLDELGSLKRAVERMGMSYRAAWGYLRELETAAGVRLVERAGAGRSGGTRLTEEGRSFVDAFLRLRERVEGTAQAEFAAAFPARRAVAERKPARRAARKRAGAPRTVGRPAAASRARGRRGA